MAPTRDDLELAIAAYWGRKDEQLAAAQLARSTAEGSSKAVRGGGHFNPIANLIARFFLDAGFPPESIHASGSMIRLPGYYRPTKSWDLVVAHDGVLVAAVELKALGGPSKIPDRANHRPLWTGNTSLPRSRVGSDIWKNSACRVSAQAADHRPTLSRGRPSG